MTKFETNYWNTNDLTLNVMQRVANVLQLDIQNNDVSDKLYWICSDLEDDDGEGEFGSSDAYSYIKQAKVDFNIE